MLYSKQILIPKNTTEANKFKTTFKVNKGIITSFWITFPPGCVGLVKMRIYHEGHPFLPVNQDNYLSGNGYTFVFPVMFEITEEPMNLSVECWNEDETYAHTINVVWLILPKKTVLPMGSTEGIMESLKSLVLHPIIMKAEIEEKT